MRTTCYSILALSLCILGCSDSASDSSSASGGSGGQTTGGNGSMNAGGMASGGEWGQGGSGAGTAGVGGASGAAGTGGTDLGGSGGEGGSDCTSASAPIPDGFHAAPNGSPSAAGSATDPLDLATALDGAASPLKPGDILYLRAGTYVGRFDSTLRGTANAPIVVRSYPGERVTLDGNGQESGSVLSVNGEFIHVSGLELMNSSTKRITSESGGNPSDIKLGGVNVYAPGAVFSHNVIHDVSGVGFWNPAVDSEFYGNVVYNVGWTGADRGHGHSLYMQNTNGTKRVEHNVMFFGHSFGIHAYTEGGNIEGFDIRENAFFRAGASVPGEGGLKDNILVGGLQPVRRLTVSGNVIWSPGSSHRGIRFGYGGSIANEDVSFTDNYIIGALRFSGTWNSRVLENNTLLSDPSGFEPSAYPNNTYLTSTPSETRTFVFADRYEPTRGLISVFNWSDADSAPVDLSAVLKPGAQFEVFSVFDLFGAPVVSGVYDGQPVSVPLGTVVAPQPIGATDQVTGADDPGKQFGAFILKSAPCK